MRRIAQLSAVTCLLICFTVFAGPLQQGATVQGTVTDLVSGEPISDARVILSGDVGQYRADSDRAGQFILTGVVPGEYKVAVTHDGYYWAKSRSGSASIVINGDLRNAYYRLVRGLSISGRILDPTGEPDSATSVAVQRAEYRNGVRTFARINPASGVRNRASTDRRGEYRLYGLEPGEYYVMTEDGETVTYYPGTADIATAVPLRLAAGRDLTGVNMTQVKSQTFTVTVEVPQDSDAAGFAHGEIRSRDLAKFQGRGAAFRPIGNNRYVSSPIRPGQYEIIWDSPAAGLSGRLAFDIVDHDLDAGSVVLNPGTTIEGRIRTSDGRVDLPRTAVRLDPVNSIMPGPSAVTNADGSFSIANVPAGEYWVEFPLLPRNYKDIFYVESVRYGRSAERGDLYVSKTSEGLLQVSLGIGSVVNGTVRNTRGDAVPYSSVLIYPIAGRQHSSSFKAVESDKNGAFTITGVAPGEHRILAWEDALPSLYLDPKFLSTFAARATTVTVRSGAPANIDVRVIPTDQ